MKDFGVLRLDYSNDHGVALREHVGFVKRFWGEMRLKPWKQSRKSSKYCIFPCITINLSREIHSIYIYIYIFFFFFLLKIHNIY
jgi:hypothetical protein